MVAETQKLVRLAVAVFDDVAMLENAGMALRRIERSSSERLLIETALLADRNSFIVASATPVPLHSDITLPILTLRNALGRTKPVAGAPEHAARSSHLTEVGRTGQAVTILCSPGRLCDLLLQAGAGSHARLEPLFQQWLPPRQSAFLENQLASGKILLWVLIRDLACEAPVCRALLDNSPYRVQVHDLKPAA